MSRDDDFKNLLGGKGGAAPGSFAESIMSGQGGPSFGMMGGGGMSDMMKTHPSTSKGDSSKQADWEVRYKQFDLSNPDDVKELEETISKVYNNPKRMHIRDERVSNDRDGFTLVTLSWAVMHVKEKKKPKPRVDEEGKEYKLQQQYPFPTIEDGAHPGEGAAIDPPGYTSVPPEEAHAEENRQGEDAGKEESDA